MKVFHGGEVPELRRYKRACDTYTAFGSDTSIKSTVCACSLINLPFGNRAPVTRMGSPSFNRKVFIILRKAVRRYYSRIQLGSTYPVRKVHTSLVSDKFQHACMSRSSVVRRVAYKEHPWILKVEIRYVQAKWSAIGAFRRSATRHCSHNRANAEGGIITNKTDIIMSLLKDSVRGHLTDSYRHS